MPLSVEIRLRVFVLCAWCTDTKEMKPFKSRGITNCVVTHIIWNCANTLLGQGRREPSRLRKSADVWPTLRLLLHINLGKEVRVLPVSDDFFKIFRFSPGRYFISNGELVGQGGGAVAMLRVARTPLPHCRAQVQTCTF